jgi:hypothetical protein
MGAPAWRSLTSLREVVSSPAPCPPELLSRRRRPHRSRVYDAEVHVPVAESKLVRAAARMLLLCLPMLHLTSLHVRYQIAHARNSTLK